MIFEAISEVNPAEPTQTPLPASEYKPGDADGDSIVKLSDVNIVLKISLEVVSLKNLIS